MWNGRPETIREAAGLGGDGDFQEFWNSVDEFMDTFYLAHPDKAAQQAMLDEAPDLLGDGFRDAWFGAMGEHLAMRWDLETPEWTHEAARMGENTPAFVPDLPGLAPILLVESPYAFRIRNVFTGREPLQRARWPRDVPKVPRLFGPQEPESALPFAPPGASVGIEAGTAAEGATDMWDIRQGSDGSIGSGVDDHVWEATLPYRTLADARGPFKPTTLVAKRDGDAFSLTVDGLSSRRFPTMVAAHQEGYRMAAEREAALLADAFASTGLSSDRWEFRGKWFSGRQNPSETIHVGTEGRGYGAALKGVSLGNHGSAADAEAAIDAVPHLEDRRLAALERAHGGGFDHHHPDHYGELEAAGYVERSGDGEVDLTEAGRAALDGDVRAASTALRDIVFEAVAKRSETETERMASSEGPMTAREARVAFNRYFVDGYGAVSGLRTLVENPGLDLWSGHADTEPHEIAVMGSGEMADGGHMRESTVLLFSPEWVEDDCWLLAEAIVECRDELVAAARPEPASPAP